MNKGTIKSILLLFFLMISWYAFSQETSTDNSYHIDGDVSVTNNGFSFIPSFSLGKPATILNLSVGGKRFSFDPQFRFDLDGIKPWSLIFIWRYKLVDHEKFQIKLGAHLPSLSFREETVQSNGMSREKNVAQRFLAPELTISYKLSENISVGAYYIYGWGLEKVDQPKNTHFLSLRSSFNNLRLSKKVFLKWSPQIYYLYVDSKYGFYVAHSLTLNHKDLPISLSTTMNKVLQSDVASKDFDWNISLIYSFSNQLIKQQP